MKTIFRSLAAFGILLGATACNTVAGVGKDTEYVGERIEDASETVEEEIDE